MAASAGTNAILKVTSSSLRDFSPYVNTTGLSREIEKLETTTLGDVDREYIPGLGENSIPFNGLYDETLDGWIAVIDRTVVAGEFYPNDDTSGKVKYAFNCFISKYEIKSSVDGVNEVDGEITISGALTRTVAS